MIVTVNAERSAARLHDAVGTEQRRIGQELHDGLGQELTGLALSARALATRAEREGQSIAADGAATLAASCIQAARWPAGSPARSATPTVKQQDAPGLAARSSAMPAVRFGSRLDASITLDLETRNHLFRIAQEAVQNALKHAGAGAVEIDLWVHARGVRLTIQDNGADCRGPARSAAGSACAPCSFAPARSAAGC